MQVVLTVLTAFIWLVPFCILNSLDRRKVTQWQKKLSGEGTFDQLITKSDAVYQKIHKDVQTLPNRIKTIAGTDAIKKAAIERHAAQTRPLLHPKVKELMRDFLSFKLRNGTKQEKAVYQDMTVEAFTDRLLKKRPFTFTGIKDFYLLRTGEEGYGINDIGTDREKAPLVLSDYLSYDEIAIAALIGISSPTFFINDGNRDNLAQLEQKGTFLEEGIYTKLVGAKFDHEGVMESAHMLITSTQNTKAHGYGADNQDKDSLLNIWAKFYGQPYFPTYDKAKSNSNLIAIKDGGKFLNKEVYKQRMQMVIEPFLVDANERALFASKKALELSKTKKNQKNKPKEKPIKAYVHAIGLGLGVWRVGAKEQAPLIAEVYAELLRKHKFEYIGDIDFSCFGKPEWEQVCSDKFKTLQTPVQIHFSKRNPADPLPPNRLLVAQFTGNGNSQAGNGYWVGTLNRSGEPAAACCSTIAELQHPDINPAVSGTNTYFPQVV